ncbi:Histone-lysine N-methyltransferase SETMAR [Anthophora retusa]
MESKNIHFRHILLFYFHKGKKAAEAHKEICEVYGVDCLTERTCQNWFKKFRSGDFSLNDDQRSGRPSEVDDDKMKAIIESNRHTQYVGKVTELFKFKENYYRHLLKQYRI